MTGLQQGGVFCFGLGFVVQGFAITTNSEGQRLVRLVIIYGV